jgi:hypothetical protein
MGNLRDEAYEKLDYLSQLTEVVVGPQNELLATIPDRAILSFEQVTNAKGYTWSRAQVYELSLVRILGEYVPDSSSALLEQIADNFAFEMSPEFEVNFEERTMVGTITLVKHNSHIEDKKVLELAVSDAIRAMNSYSWPSKKLRDRAMVILNTLEDGRGTEWAKGVEGRVFRQAGEAITKLLRAVILDNKWRVRDGAVIAKMGQWIGSYMMDEQNGVGLVNLLKLKIMVNKDLPVYSIDEVKRVKPT